MKTGSELIAEERQRQIKKEGWTPKHDNTHTAGQLAMAAACYALNSVVPGGRNSVHAFWPWRRKDWKPANKAEMKRDDEKWRQDRIKDLVRAGALIAAEIDRLQRLTKQEGE